jgi:hypothetical protein
MNLHNKYINNINNIQNTQLTGNDKINEQITFNPLNYMPDQSTVPIHEQQNMQMIIQPDNQQQYQPNQQQYQPNQQQQQNLTTNDVLNARTFNQDCFMKGSLVPINMHHHFSRNLFQEGTPIPQDLLYKYSQQPNQQQQSNQQQHNQPNHQQQSNQQQHNQPNHQQYQNSQITQLQNQWSQQGYQNGHQFRSKTLYKDELNNRLQNLSPLSDRLYMPIDKKIETESQIYKSMTLLEPNERQISNNNIKFNSNNRDELNNRLNQYKPLTSVLMMNNQTNNITDYQLPMPSI